MTLPDPVFACCARTFPVRPIIDDAETPWTRDELDARIDHWMTQLKMLAAWGEREESTQSGVCTVSPRPVSKREYILSIVAERGLVGGDAETAVDAYLATPPGAAHGADSIRVDAILKALIAEKSQECAE